METIRRALPSLRQERLEMALVAMRTCPKCGAEMEAIEADDRLPLRQLHLCPMCYLVAWNDAAGLQVRQGVPVRTNDKPRARTIN